MSEHECTADCAPPGLHAVRPNGDKVPVAAEPERDAEGNQVRTKSGDYVLMVKVPEGSVEAFAADGPLPDGHALTFVSPEWVRDLARKALSMKTSGPETGPANEQEEQDDDDDR